MKITIIKLHSQYYRLLNLMFYFGDKFYKKIYDLYFVIIGSFTIL
jgi:hypothetical protein